MARFFGDPAIEWRPAAIDDRRRLEPPNRYIPKFYRPKQPDSRIDSVDKPSVFLTIWMWRVFATYR
jgi:hypothetical protein